jgi:hypothetical protein
LTDEWLQKEELVPYARKLILLLASGEHEYLKELIDRLYAKFPPEPGQTEEEEDAE